MTSCTSTNTHCGEVHAGEQWASALALVALPTLVNAYAQTFVVVGTLAAGATKTTAMVPHAPLDLVTWQLAF
jgi:hypothetical protein